MKKLFLIVICLTCYLSSFAQNNSIDKDKLFDLYQSQQYAEAAQYLKSVYGEETSDFKILSQMGYCYSMAGNTVEAEKYYLKAYTQQPQNLATLFNLAKISSRRGNVEKSKEYYSRIIKIDSNNFAVYKQLASLYNLPTDSLKLVYLLKANQMNPAEADVAEDLSEAYLFRQKKEKSYEVLSIAIAADTDNFILQKAKMPIANGLKKYQEVIVIGEKLLKNSKDVNVIKDLANAYYYTKKYEKAIDLFKQLEAMKIQNEGTLYVTSLCYRALRNYSAATIYTKRTINEAISENTADYYALLGLVHEENGQYVQAGTAYKKGLTFKEKPVLYYRLAVLNDTKLKKDKIASSYYKRYLKSKPNEESDKEEIKFAKFRMEQIKLTD